jgi:PilZ domain
VSTKPDVATDQRNTVRHLCSWPIAIQILGDPARQRLRVQIRDVSVAGIGLVIGKPLDVGARLALDWNFGSPDCWKSLQARVIHVTPDGEQFLVGCAFDAPLDESDLNGLLVWDGSRLLAFDS